MPRRLLSLALVGYLGLAVWILSSRFAAWGDDLSATVGQVVRSWTITPPPAPSAGGIDFIECYGCDRLPGSEGFGMGLLFLLIVGAPLAALAAALDGQRGRAAAISGAWFQAGFVLQGASVGIAALVLCGFGLSAREMADLVHWMSGLALVDIAAGVPALVAWRRLHARAFGVVRPVLRRA